MRMQRISLRFIQFCGVTRQRRFHLGHRTQVRYHRKHFSDEIGKSGQN
jgi:hypothetical protein